MTQAYRAPHRRSLTLKRPDGVYGRVLHVLILEGLVDPHHMQYMYILGPQRRFRVPERCIVSV